MIRSWSAALGLAAVASSRALGFAAEAPVPVAPLSGLRAVSAASVPLSASPLGAATPATSPLAAAPVLAAPAAPGAPAPDAPGAAAQPNTALVPRSEEHT